MQGAPALSSYAAAIIYRKLHHFTGDLFITFLGHEFLSVFNVNLLTFSSKTFKYHPLCVLFSHQLI